ncbi:MAG: L-threonylcarbamoyladenylate synthase [Candidatus Aureabacteria bacterium]|nr:L-threonylcarbamoyladenylate synthase [Candidatus Auribacterota bacterium]
MMVRTKILELTGGPEDRSRIEQAARALAEGKIVVFPTETVYGAGCNASDRSAVKRLYEIKGRPWNKPLACYLSSRLGMLRYDVEVALIAERVMERFWPGPLTILLARYVGGGRVGFRFPDEENALALIETSGVPVVATSANRSGGASPMSGGEAVMAMDGLADIVLKGGVTRCRGESTIVDLSGPAPRLVREGVVTRDELEAFLGCACGAD